MVLLDRVATAPPRGAASDSPAPTAAAAPTAATTPTAAATPIAAPAAPGSWPVGRRRVLKAALATSLAVALLAVVLPRAAGAEWAQVGRVLAAVSPAELSAMALLWWLGLWVHTVALTAALPGLTSSRALLLNLSGSFVSNLFPLGGAAGTVANYSMARGWGFSPAAFARWAVVTNIWDTLLKLALPGTALLGLAVVGVGSRGDLALWAGFGAVCLLLFGTAVLCLARGERCARALGAAADAVARRVGRRVPAPGGYAARAAGFRRDSAALIAAKWGHLTAGKVAYALLQAALLWLCLRTVGAQAGLAVVFAAFAAERILSLAVLTPGATGFTEVGMAGLLVAFGTDPASATAGVLVYRAFTFGMEIPVGGLGLLWWASRRQGRTAAAW